MQLRASFYLKKSFFNYCLIQIEDGKFLEFIYFSSFMISMNFLDQLVTDMSEPVLKN